MVRRCLPLLIGLAVGLGACADDAEPGTRPDLVSHETVERYRTDVLLRLQEVDAGIAALEGRVAEAESASAAALAPAVEALRADRRAVQTRLEALDVQARGAFDEATRAIDRGVAVLRQRVAQAAQPVVPDSTAESAPESAPEARPPAPPDTSDD